VQHSEGPPRLNNIMPGYPGLYVQYCSGPLRGLYVAGPGHPGLCNVVLGHQVSERCAGPPTGLCNAVLSDQSLNIFLKAVPRYPALYHTALAQPGAWGEQETVKVMFAIPIYCTEAGFSDFKGSPRTASCSSMTTTSCCQNFYSEYSHFFQRLLPNNKGTHGPVAATVIG
jgi:hypothetical protein